MGCGRLAIIVPSTCALRFWPSDSGFKLRTLYDLSMDQIGCGTRCAHAARTFSRRNVPTERGPPILAVSPARNQVRRVWGVTHGRVNRVRETAQLTALRGLCALLPGRRGTEVGYVKPNVPPAVWKGINVQNCGAARTERRSRKELLRARSRRG